MFSMKLLSAAALAVALAAGAGAAAAAESHSHDGHSAGAAALKLDHGKRWQTDEELRAGMSGIREAMAGSLDAIHHGKLSPAQFDGLAAKIEERINHIVSNCKLPPEADEQLHLLLSDVVEGADAMRKDGQRTDGAVTVVKALEAYGRFFDHPGWQPLAH